MTISIPDIDPSAKAPRGLSSASFMHAPTNVRGLPEDEQELLIQAWKLWTKRRAKNKLLDVYYDGHRAFRDLGISIPPQMQQTRAALGWPAKAVTALARKHVFEGFSMRGQVDAFDTADILAANSFDVELSQAITSAYKHSCAFLTVTQGDESLGEPPVLIQARDAGESAALWDQNRRQIEAFLTVTSTDDDNAPTHLLLFTRSNTWALSREGSRWEAASTGRTNGRLPVHPIVYDPQLSRPFGRSRITREVRYLTDAAIRTLVRAETSAEFFTSPQRYILGVDSDAADQMDRWTAIIGRIQVLSPNENGDTPQVGQFQQLSMSPHLEMYRQLAQNFCAATNLPQSQVGLFADNPASAEAMQAAEAALADEAEAQWRIFTGPLRRLLQDVVMTREKLNEPPAESWGVDVRWTPARYASPAASADFAVKMVQAFPDLAGSTTLMRRAGLTESDLAAIQAEGSKTSILDHLDALTNQQTQGDEPGEPTTDDETTEQS